MHLFIKVENTRCLLTDVYLKDGYFPCIGDHKQEVSVPPMEPAIWCKVLVLDSVLVDCNIRTIRWSTQATASNDDEQDWQSLNEEISEYDDEDELFHLARSVFDRTSPEEASNAFVIDDDSKMSLLRMLHCLVLPKVSFCTSDLEKVQSAKIEQLQSVEVLNSQFQAINKSASIVQEMLHKILNDLRHCGYSQINGADARGFRPTDVLPNGVKPEWQKLSEQVATYVFDTEHPVGASFEQSCLQIHDMCQTALNLQERIAIEDSSGNVEERSSIASQIAALFSNCMPIRSNKGQHHGSYESLHVPALNNQGSNPYQVRLEGLKMIIFAYFEETTEVLLELFNKSGDSHFKDQLRIAYENCFYQRVEDLSKASDLVRVYELVNYDKVSHLRDNTKRLRGLPTALFQLPINDAYMWLYEIFDQRIPMREPIPMCEPISLTSYLSSGGTNESFDELKTVTSIFIDTVRNQCQNVATKAPTEMSLTSSLLEEYESKAKTIRESIRRTFSLLLSQSSSEDDDTDTCQASSCQDEEKEEEEIKKKVTFEKYFGSVLQHMKDILTAVGPFEKLKKMVAALKEMANNVARLKLLHGKNASDSAATADDMLTLLVLMLLQMEPSEVALMLPQLAMVEDLMPPFLTGGYYGWALTQFQLALKVLDDLCSEF